MKKLRLNNIFHWLYAILMFWPFINFVVCLPVYFGTAFDISNDLGITWGQYFNDSFLFFMDAESGVASTIYNVFEYLFVDIFGLVDNTDFTFFVINLFTYWVIVSLGYLCFDVLMFIINLAHRWIDRGSDL